MARFPVARILLTVLFVILARVEPPGGMDQVMGGKGYPSRPGRVELSVPTMPRPWDKAALALCLPMPDRRGGNGPGLSVR